MTVSAAEVLGKIDATKYGEYDSFHEWNASFSFADKCAVLAGLLAGWESTDAEGRRLVLQFVRLLGREMYNIEPALAEALVSRADLPEVVAAAGELLFSAWFSLAILESMKVRGLKQADWLAAIRDHWVNLKFTKDKRGVPVKELYRRIGDSLGEIPPVFS